MKYEVYLIRISLTLSFDSNCICREQNGYRWEKKKECFVDQKDALVLIQAFVINMLRALCHVQILVSNPSTCLVLSKIYIYIYIKGTKKRNPIYNKVEECKLISCTDPLCNQKKKL